MNQEFQTTKVLHLTVYNQVSGPAPRSIPRPYTEAEILNASEVTPLLKQGYKLESFTNEPFANDPYTLLVTVILTRAIGHP